jgi:hypothetical protein
MRTWIMVVPALAATACPKTESGGESSPEVLTGEFKANHPELGTWTIRPIGCEDGQAYGFQGILFRFPLPPKPAQPPEAPPPSTAPPSRTPSSPPEEIRLDLARDGDNTIELRYPDRDATVRKLRERECASFTGSLTRHVRQSGAVRMRGNGSVDCPAFGLHVRFEVNGCLPQRK